MTCRCRSREEHAARAVRRVAESAETYRVQAEKEALEKKVQALSPDNSRFRILKAQPVDNNLVLKVEYPNCKACSYEGIKVIVFQDVSPSDALLWETLDPHFRELDLSGGSNPHAAPPPFARFPASDPGWAAAIRCAEGC